MNKYIGHESQLYSVEEMRLLGGKGDGMKILNVRNASGLQLVIVPDRCMDIYRVNFKGDNCGYFSACGYVAPQYYDKEGFLKSFTAGFLTTCGLTSVGSPCVDDGEECPMHGTVSNIPAEHVNYWIEDGKIHIKGVMRDAALFAHKLLLEREYIIPVDKNVVYMTDKITNIGSEETPLEVLYHCNMGYPLLSEDAVVTIPATEVKARDAHAESGIDVCLKMEKPQKGYQEMCFYHKLSGKPTVSIYNKKIGKGMNMEFDTAELKCFTEWKMMGEYDYVLGLEPGNCLPDGRKAMREQGILEFLKPDEVKTHHIKFEFTEEEGKLC